LSQRRALIETSGARERTTAAEGKPWRRDMWAQAMLEKLATLEEKPEAAALFDHSRATAIS